MTKEQLIKLHTAMCNDNEHQCNRLNNYIHTDEYLTAEVVKVVDSFINEVKEKSSKWHNVKENPDDLPKRDKNFCTNVSVAVFTKPIGVALYYFDDKKWYCQGKEVEVIEWCEIPQ